MNPIEGIFPTDRGFTRTVAELNSETFVPLHPAVSQSLRNRTRSYAKVVLREFLHHLKDLLFKER